MLAKPRSSDEPRAARLAPTDPVRSGNLAVSRPAEIADFSKPEQKRLIDANDPEAVFAEAKRLRAGRIAVKHAAKIVKPLPNGVYDCIYADPAWRFGDGTTDPSRAIERHYDTMSLDEIKALPVPDIAAKDCILFLWTTAPHLAEAMEVLTAWGFQYKSNMVWDKTRIGMGHYSRVQHEHLLIATRGSPGTPPDELLQSSVYREKPGKHSMKPEWFRKTIERYYPKAKRIELFARARHEGWDVWGNEVPEAADP